MLYEHAVRDAPFYVIESGLVEFVDRKPGKDVYIAQADGRTFIGDIAVFTGEPTISACVAVEPTEVIVFDRAGLRDMVARWPEFGEHVFRTLLARRAWHEAEGYGVMRLIAPRGLATRVRGARPARAQPAAGALVRRRYGRRERRAARLARHPALRDARAGARHRGDAESLGRAGRALARAARRGGRRSGSTSSSSAPGRPAWRARSTAGSEGLRTFVAEAWAPGGQAGTSTRIENYLGFPSGVSGTELTRKATLQARRFDAVLSSFHRAVELADGSEGLVRVDLDDGQHVLARSLVMATGARWRELQAEGIDRFRGAGVYHAAMATDAERRRDEDVIVVGGGNSAGQAATQLATRARSVRVVVRGKALKSTMSQYLVDRIERSPRIEVMTETELVAVHGSATVESVSLRDRRDGRVEQVACDGRLRDDRRAIRAARPPTGCSRWTTAGYLLCGTGAAELPSDTSAGRSADREPHLLETVRPGVFAAGDVRAEASNRVAGAVGDGAMVVRFAQQVLAG